VAITRALASLSSAGKQFEQLAVCKLEQIGASPAPFSRRAHLPFGDSDKLRAARTFNSPSANCWNPSVEEGARTLIRSDVAPIMKAPRGATGSESEIARCDLRRGNQIRIQEKTTRTMKINFLSKRERRCRFSGQLFMGCPGNSLFTASLGFFFYLHSCISPCAM
jgi:hypothetical protein